MSIINPMNTAINISNSADKKNNSILSVKRIYSWMIVVSSLMIVSSIMTSIGFIVWFKNFSPGSGFTSESQAAAYNTGAWVGLAGGIATSVFAFVSITLLIVRIILSKRFRKDILAQIPSRIISLFLFIMSWLPLPIIIIIGLAFH